MARKKVFAKSADLGLGTHILGMKTSLQSLKGTTIEVTPIGLYVISPASKKKILVPYANIKAIDFDFSADVDFFFDQLDAAIKSEQIKEVAVEKVKAKK